MSRFVHGSSHQLALVRLLPVAFPSYAKTD